MATERTSIAADVVVIGAGFAGLSAAVRLAEARKRVVVVEAAPRLGGRASTFADPATGERVDNGQHVLFGCYRETYAFLQRIGTDHLAPLDPRLKLTIAGPDGTPCVLSCPSLPSPWHVVAGVLKWDAIALPDRMSALKMALAIKMPGAAEGTVAEWLRAKRQSPELCRWLWYPLAVAALNQSPEVAMAAPFARVLRELMGFRAKDSAIGLPIVPLDELYAIPAARFVEARGGTVLTKSPGRVVLDARGRVAAVRAGSTSTSTSVVVSAVPWHGFERLWQEDCPPVLADLAARAGRMSASPIVTVNLWLDGPIMPDRFVGLVDGTMHWAFDKSAIFGARAGHVSVVSSGMRDLARMNNDEVTKLALDDLGRALPLVSERRLLRSVVGREQQATFSLDRDSPARPATVTPLAGFYLAGDWVDTGLPATIESAVRSGHAAADQILKDFSKRALVR